MSFTIFSTLDGPISITSPVLGAPGVIIDSPFFDNAVMNGGVMSLNGYVIFPTRSGSEELVSNSAGTISIWVSCRFNSGTIHEPMVLFSLYNDDGSNIIVFYDDNLQKFAFSESEIGEAFESNAHSLSQGQPLHIVLRWNGNTRELLVDNILVASQNQGAQFVPNYLALGAVDIGGEKLESWRYFEGVLDNLKVLDEYCSNLEIFASEGIVSNSDRGGFTRTILVSKRSSYISALIDNQRNAHVNCSGAADERFSILRTGGSSLINAYLDVLCGSSRSIYSSAPSISDISVSLAGSSSCDASANASIVANGESESTRSVCTTAQTTTDAQRNIALSAQAEALSGRNCALVVVGSGENYRFTKITATANVDSQREAAYCAGLGGNSYHSSYIDSASGQVAKRISGSKNATLYASEDVFSSRLSEMRAKDTVLQNRSSWLGGGLELTISQSAFAIAQCSIDNTVNSYCLCEIPVAIAEAWIFAANSSHPDWLGNLLSWMKNCIESDEYLAPMIVDSFSEREMQPLGWGIAKVPSIKLVSSKVSRITSGDEGDFQAILNLEIRAYQSSNSIDNISSRIIRSLDTALRNHSIPTACGVLSLETSLEPIRSNRRVATTKITVLVKAVVNPAGALY